MAKTTRPRKKKTSKKAPDGPAMQAYREHQRRNGFKATRAPSAPNAKPGTVKREQQQERWSRYQHAMKADAASLAHQEGPSEIEARMPIVPPSQRVSTFRTPHGNPWARQRAKLQDRYDAAERRKTGNRDILSVPHGEKLAPGEHRYVVSLAGEEGNPPYRMQALEAVVAESMGEAATLVRLHMEDPDMGPGWKKIEILSIRQQGP